MDPSSTAGSTRFTQLQDQLRQLYHDEPLYAPHASLCFQNLALLGQGGMGAVYRVRDSRLGRDAALKVLKQPDLRSEQRFLREARIMGRLNHPGIPPLHEAGRMASGELYMLMRVIEGQTLDDHIRAYHAEGRDPAVLRGLIEALIKVCEALSYAHSEGVIHRDLKPENIMIGRFGEVLLMDWGIAKDLSESEDPTEILDGFSLDETPPESGLTIAGTILGTPGYMPPEQANGEVADKRSDVFALGAILYELLTGQRPFTGDSLMERLCSTVKGHYPPIRQQVRSAPRELTALTAAALQNKRSRRPASAERFARDLRAYLAGEELTVYRYSAFERGRRLLARYPLVLLAVSALSLLGLAAGFLALQAAEAQAKAEAAEREREQADASRERLAKALATFAKARDLVRRQAPEGKLRQAIDAALELSGGSYPALLEAGAIYEEGRMLGMARATFERAAKLKRPGYEALLRLHLIDTVGRGEKLFLTEWIEEMARRAEAEDSAEEFPLFARAYVLRARGRYEAALALVDRIESAAPRSYWAALERGNILNAQNKTKEARASLDRAIAINPAGATAYLAYGRRASLRQSLGDWRGALADYDRALESNPRFTMAYVNRGIIYFQLERREQALEDLDKAVRYGPGIAPTFLNRAKVNTALGNLEAALADCNSGLELTPKDARLYFQRACVRASMRDFDQASEDLARAAKIDPEFPMPKLMQASLALRQELLAAAAEDSLKPDEARELVFEAEGLFKQRRYNPALRLLDRALRLNPVALAADGKRAECFIRLGRFEEARSAAERAMILEPFNLAGYNNRSVALYQLGRIEEARADLETLLRLFPKSLYAPTARRLMSEMTAKLAERRPR